MSPRADTPLRPTIDRHFEGSVQRGTQLARDVFRQGASTEASCALTVAARRTIEIRSYERDGRRPGHTRCGARSCGASDSPRASDWRYERANRVRGSATRTDLRENHGSSSTGATIAACPERPRRDGHRSRRAEAPRHSGDVTPAVGEIAPEREAGDGRRISRACASPNVQRGVEWRLR